jgi:HK97 family phage major capsid protein
VLATQQDAVGRYYWDPTVAVSRRAKGYPVLLSDNVPDTDDSAVSTAFIVFGNPKYTLYGIRMGMEIKYFTETMYAVQDDENFFRIRTRFAGVVGLPANYAVLRTASS